MQVPTIEQANARRDAAKFYAAAEQAIAAGYDAHAAKMLGLFIDARNAADLPVGWTPAAA